MMPVVFPAALLLKALLETRLAPWQRSSELLRLSDIGCQEAAYDEGVLGG
jgi:hypothetical protein